MMRRLWDLIETIVRFCLCKVLRLKLTEERVQSFLQFVKFGIVGVSNNLIFYAVYLVLLHFGMHYVPANILGFTVSVVNAYYWNNKYVFQSGGKLTWWKTFIKTFISYAGTGIVLSNILLIFWVELIHIPQAIAPLINLMVTIPLNFIINKLWAFKEKK